MHHVAISAESSQAGYIFESVREFALCVFASVSLKVSINVGKFRLQNIHISYIASICNT